MKKFVLRISLIEIISLLIFNLFAFLIPFDRLGSYWIGYAFAMFAILIQLPFMYYSFKKGNSVKSKLFGFPLARLSTIYLVVQLILSIVVMPFGESIPAWVTTLIFATILGVVLIGFIAVDTMREEIFRQDDKLKQNTNKIKNLRSLVASMPMQTKDENLRKDLEKFSEDLQYSDPVSNDSLADIENELSILTDELSQSIINEDIPGATQLCKKAKEVLIERNRLCKLSK